MSKVHCNNCDFEGSEDDLVLCIEDGDGENKRKYHGEKYDETKQSIFKGCPNCFDDGALDDNGKEE